MHVSRAAPCFAVARAARLPARAHDALGFGSNRRDSGPKSLTTILNGHALRIPDEEREACWQFGARRHTGTHVADLHGNATITDQEIQSVASGPCSEARNLNAQTVRGAAASQPHAKRP